MMRSAFLLLILLSCLNCAAQKKQKARTVIIFKEFDGVSKNGDWRKQYGGEYSPACDWNKWVFEATPAYGRMYRDGGYGDCPSIGNNQHVVRYDKTIDQNRPYTIECDFLTDTNFVSPINSFCINFNVQKGMSPDSRINCWSINLDIHDKKEGAYTIKRMGFADLPGPNNQYKYGWFTELSASSDGKGALTAPHVNHFKIEVNRRLNGDPAPKWVTITWSDAKGVHEHFEADYSKFIYQPDPAKPVRVGLNTHGIGWTVKNLLVYY